MTWQHLRRSRLARGIAVLAPVVAVMAAGLAAMPTAGAGTGSIDNDAAIVGVADKCVDVTLAQPADGTPVRLWDCNGTGAQRWQFDGQEGPVRALDKCLGVADGSTEDGTAARLFDCDRSDAQRWRVTKGRLIHSSSGKCLDAHDGDDNGTPLQIWKCADSPAQVWHTPTPVADPVAAKKGVGTWAFPRLADSIRAVRAGWYYDWSSGDEDVPAQAEFVPMIWGPGSVTDAELTSAKTSGTALLGFHEPDRQDQSDLEVEKALELWPRLVETGLRMGSPAVASDADIPGGWLDRFMTGAREKNLRVDFITLHWFGSDFGDAAVGQLMSYVEKVHERYDMPIWVTQFGLTDFTGEPRYPNAEQLTAFIKGATERLEATPYVERYAYSSLPAMGESQAYGLYHEDATATAAGEAYRDAGTSQDGVPDEAPPVAEQSQQKDPQQKEKPEPADDAAMEGRMIDLINVERAKAHCQPIATNDALTAAARAHSKLMAQRKQATHKFPDEADVGDRFTAAGYTWSAIAENATSGAFSTPEIAMYGKHDPTTELVGFLESADHHASIVNCGYRDVGVGVARDADGGPWWTQDFGTPR